MGDTGLRDGNEDPKPIQCYFYYAILGMENAAQSNLFS